MIHEISPYLTQKCVNLELFQHSLNQYNQSNLTKAMRSELSAQADDTQCFNLTVVATLYLNRT